MDVALQIVINSLVAGSLYSLAAAGFTLIFGVLRVAHFAHGDVAMVGAYVALAVVALWGGQASVGTMAVGLGAGIVASMAVGVLVERWTYRPLRGAPAMQILIAAIAVARLLQSILQMTAGSSIQMFPIAQQAPLVIGGARITPVQLTVLGVSALLFTGLYFLINRTHLGAQIRAVADNPALARVQGIPVERVTMVVFACSSALAAVAGVLQGLVINIHPAMGFVLVLKAFAAVVLGGLGSIPGAIIGAFALGLFENVGAWYTSGIWKEPIAYLVLLLMLLIKPSGLLGRSTGEEVKL